MTDLDHRAGGIHQEITGAMGPNIGTLDIKDRLRANNMANQLGLDPASLGFTLSFAMELVSNGILRRSDCDDLDLRFGTSQAALEMTRRIAHWEGFAILLPRIPMDCAEQPLVGSRHLRVLSVRDCADSSTESAGHGNDCGGHLWMANLLP